MLGAVFELLEEASLVEDEAEVLEVLVEGVGDGPVDVDALHDLEVGLLDLLVERADHVVQFLLVVLLLALPEEQLVQREVLVAVAQCVHFDALQELRGELVLRPELEEVLDAVESLVVVEHEEVLVLLLLGHVPQPVQRVEGAEVGRAARLRHCLLLQGLVADERSWLVLGVRAGVVALAEEILLVFVEYSLLLHRVAIEFILTIISQ